MTLRIAVVDDHRIFADAVADVLRELADCDVVGVAGDASDAMSLIDRERPDVMLLDYHLPGVDGGELARRARALMPDLRIIVWSANKGELVREECLRAGAEAVISKDRGLEAILETLSPA
jgi:DNA-binding NarL/FixJ family response regulator